MLSMAFYRLKRYWGIKWERWRHRKEREEAEKIVTGCEPDGTFKYGSEAYWLWKDTICKGELYTNDD